tara:strand:- start:32629 stop:33591 length:963 start_codon:yes stop_codon:yes gene_type:complete
VAIGVSSIGFFFDVMGMNHLHSASRARLLSAVSITTILIGAGMATGCASSQSRTQASQNNQNQVQTQEQVQSSNEWTPIVAESTEPTALTVTRADLAPGMGDEFIIGNAFASELVPAYRTPISKYSMSDIQIELEAMYDLDQELVSSSLADDPKMRKHERTVHAIDVAHSDRLKEIVDHIGWPTRDRVGLKATQAAYMVIQHAGHDNDFQNRCLALMIDLVEDGELPASYVALLTDRIRAFQGQSQVFGTQMAMQRNQLGQMVPTPTVPIEDPEHLDERRALMGMPPHAEFAGAIAIAYQASINDPGTAFAEVSETYDGD